MRQSFIIQRASVLAADAPSLMREVAGHTGSDTEAESILRSLERLGSDTSIGYYEATPISARRSYRGASDIVWSVRAVRR